MSDLPAGTVTFVFTDIEGSTRLLEAGPVAYRAALARHDAIVRQAVAAHGGIIFKIVGDGCCAAFANPAEALRAALEAQVALRHEPWGVDDPIRARMALHTGHVDLQDGEYFGAPLHRCARLMGSAHGGQTLLSAVTAALVGEALPNGIRLKDLGEYRLRDLARPERVYQLVGADLPTDFAPLRTPTGPPNNLPTQATAFIGREQQIQAVSELLRRPATRLLTLTGPGGTGKTRLSLQVADEILDSFQNGVFFVPLASISDPDLVPSAIAQVLDVRETAGRSIVAALGDALRQKRLLLVLDNFEQVLDAASLIAELIGTAPCLKVLVTSRAALRVYGERELAVPPMALPDRRVAPTAAHLARFEAVRLFVERAQDVRPDLQLTDENAPDVAEICQRLDGLPLAIELAAARIRSLPPRAMLQRMERRLPLLTGGARDLPARQRTLRDTIAWSYDLLTPGEQTLFRRLAVFRGCTLEAAETVCAGEAPRTGATSVALPNLDIDVLDGLESLVEKSLLRQEEGSDGQAWYFMLETVREYALERLTESGEADTVHRQQVLAALHLAESSEDRLYGEERAAWVARLEQEHDNLRTALDWCEMCGYAQAALRVAVALWWFWSGSGHIKEGRERMDRLLARFPLKDGASSTRATLQARMLLGDGMLASMQGDHTLARSLQEAGLAIRRTMPDRIGVFSALEAAGTAACLQGDYAAARRHLEEALAIGRESGDQTSVGNVIALLGNVSYALGELDVARRYYEASVAAFSEGNADIYRALNGAMLSIAAVALEQGDLDGAQALAAKAMAGSEQTGQAHLRAFVLVTIGAVALARGDQGTAREHLSRSIELCRQTGDLFGVAQMLERFVELAAAQDRYEGALRIAAAASALHEQAGAPLTPHSQAKLDRALAPARQHLPAEVVNAAWQDGLRLDVEAAVGAALAITELAPAPDALGGTSTTMSQDAGVSVLTPREQETAVLIAQGYSNKQIAEALVVTEGTAANHVHNVLGKLGFANRAQVAAWWSSTRPDADTPGVVK